MNIAFIPARCGSKSIKLKNIKEFCSKPLIYWSLLALQKAKLVDVVYVATDCKEIEDIVKSFNFTKLKIYRRDKENAQDTSSTEDVMLEFLSKNNFNHNDLFMLVQATSPLSRSSDFDKAITQYTKGDKDSLMSVVQEKRFFWSREAKAINYDYKNRPRRQDFDGYFLENGAFYINKVANILKYKNRLCGNIGLFEMPSYNAIDIDEEIDWIVAEAYMKKYVLLLNS